jgi:hypothetical protein
VVLYITPDTALIVCAFLGFVAGMRFLVAALVRPTNEKRTAVACHAWRDLPHVNGAAKTQVALPPANSVMLMTCRCGNTVPVNAALALARPGRMIQKCRCGDIVWPVRPSGPQPSVGTAEDRRRAVSIVVPWHTPAG